MNLILTGKLPPSRTSWQTIKIIKCKKGVHLCFQLLYAHPTITDSDFENKERYVCRQMCDHRRPTAFYLYHLSLSVKHEFHIATLKVRRKALECSNTGVGSVIRWQDCWSEEVVTAQNNILHIWALTLETVTTVKPKTVQRILSNKNLKTLTLVSSPKSELMSEFIIRFNCRF